MKCLCVLSSPYYRRGNWAGLVGGHPVHTQASLPHFWVLPASLGRQSHMTPKSCSQSSEPKSSVWTQPIKSPIILSLPPSLSSPWRRQAQDAQKETNLRFLQGGSSQIYPQSGPAPPPRSELLKFRVNIQGHFITNKLAICMSFLKKKKKKSLFRFSAHFTWVFVAVCLFLMLSI